MKTDRISFVSFTSRGNAIRSPWILLGILMSYGTKWLMATFAPTMPMAIVQKWWLIAGAIALVGALVGAVYPGLKAARQEPIEALSLAPSRNPPLGSDATGGCVTCCDAEVIVRHREEKTLSAALIT